MSIISPQPCTSGGGGSEGGATETTLAAILVELGQKLEPGGEVSLSPATLAALENITVTVTNPSETGLAKEVTLAAVLAELGQKLEPGGEVVLSAATLSALETVTVLQGTSPWVVSATDLDIRNLLFATDKVDASGSSVSVSNFPASQPISGSVTITGEVEVKNDTGNPLPVNDDYGSFEAQHVVLGSSVDTTITFAQPVRAVHIKNWDILSRVLVKDGAIASDSDATASRVGKAPVADVAGSDWFPFSTTTIHLRSAGGNEVTVEGYY